MTQITSDQRAVLQAAGWTEEEVTGFVQAMAAFRDGLPPRQRDAFTAILTAAGDTAGDDVHGHLVVNAIIAVLIGLLVPAVQKDSGWSTTVPGNTRGTN